MILFGTILKKFFRSQFYYFAIVGSIGFIIDTSVFYVLHLEIDYALSRIISILTALTITWLANRTITFQVEKKASHLEWLKYVVMNSIGALINFSVFIFLAKSNPFLKQYFIIPLALATGVSMWFNFGMNKFYIFRKKK